MTPAGDCRFCGARKLTSVVVIRTTLAAAMPFPSVACDVCKRFQP